MSTTTDHPTKESTDCDFVIARTFDAPRDLVFKAWTEPERMKHWWGPKGFTSPACKLDLRPGGMMHYCMRSPDGREMWGKFAYREVVVPERLVYINSFSDAEGGLTRHPMSPTWPLELLTTATFEEHSGKTTLTIRWGLLPSATEPERKTFNEGHSSMQQGWTGTLDQLTAYLEKATQENWDLVLTREFEVSRELVFETWTDAALVAQWWGPHGFTNPVCEWAAQPGGAIRIDMRSPEGTVYPMTGVFQEIVEPERLSFTSVALDGEGQPLFEILNTVTLTGQGGRTTQTLRARVGKATAAGAPHLEGMEEGWSQSLERLNALLEKSR